MEWTPTPSNSHGIIISFISLTPIVSITTQYKEYTQILNPCIRLRVHDHKSHKFHISSPFIIYHFKQFNSTQNSITMCSEFKTSSKNPNFG